MDGTFVSAFEELVREPKVEVVNGRERLLAPHPWSDITPKQPTAAPLVVGTLTGFADYIRANVDDLPMIDCLVHVVDPGRVDLVAKLEDEAACYRRQTFLQATTGMVAGSPFTRITSAWRVTAQKPGKSPGSGCQATGAALRIFA